MPESNEIMSVEGQLVGMPLAGPESFSQQQLDYLKRALGVDETVLWDNYTFANNKAASVVMTETPFNFSQVRITFCIEASDASWGTLQTQLIDMVALDSNTNQNFTLNGTVVNGTTIIVRGSKCNFNGTSITESSTVQWYNGGSSSMSNALHIYRIVGVGRIAGGN